MCLVCATPEVVDRLGDCKLLLEHPYRAVGIFPSTDADGDPSLAGRSALSAMKSHVSETSTGKGIKAIAFTTGLNYPVIADLPLWKNGPVEESIIMGDLFPHGSVSIRLLDVAGLGFPVGYSFRLYVDNLQATTPMNSAIFHTFSIPWSGNAVLVRYGGPEYSGRAKEEASKLQHCAKGDLFVSCLLMALWLREMIVIGLYDDVKVHPDDPAMRAVPHSRPHPLGEAGSSKKLRHRPSQLPLHAYLQWNVTYGFRSEN